MASSRLTRSLSRTLSTQMEGTPRQQEVTESERYAAVILASHDELLRWSDVYRNLFVEHKALQVRLTDLQASHHTVMNEIRDHITHCQPNGSIQQATPDPPLETVIFQRPTINKAEHPGVRFWAAKSWNRSVRERKQNSRTLVIDEAGDAVSESGSKVPLTESHAYLEQSDGTPADEQTLQAMRKFVKDVFADLQKETNPTLALPETWAHAGAACKKYLEDKCYQKYPLFMYCDNDWKVHHLAGTCFSEAKANVKKQVQRRLKGSNASASPESSNAAPINSYQTGDKRPISQVDGAHTAPNRQPAPPNPELADLRHQVTPQPDPGLSNPAPVPIRPMPQDPTSDPSTPEPGSETAGTDVSRMANSNDTRNPPTDAHPTSTRASLDSDRQSRDSSPSATNASIVSATQGSATNMQSSLLDPRLTNTSTDTSTGPGTPPPGPNEEPASTQGRLVLHNPLTQRFGNNENSRTPGTERTNESELSREETRRPLEGQLANLPDGTAHGPGTNELEVPPLTEADVLALDVPRGMKKPTKSTSAKNLCYIAYVQTHRKLLSPKDFDTYFSGLSLQIRKMWAVKSTEAATSRQAVESTEGAGSTGAAV